MKLIKLNPVTNGTRHQINLQKAVLSKKNRFLRVSMKGLNHSFGRSSLTGHITAWHRSKGHKKLFRYINNSNDSYNGVVLFISYDPFRSAFVSLNFDLEKKKFFRTLSTNSITPGCLIKCNSKILDLKLGARTSLNWIPSGSIIHNLSLQKSEKAKYIRSAGTFGQVLQINKNTVKVKLPSNHIVETSVNAFATLGVVSNLINNLTVMGKAGKNRLKGRRPIVRGVAMNPVDHPHGGRSSGGKPGLTPWGLPTKNKFVLKKRK